MAPPARTRGRPQLVSWVAVPCLGAAATTAVGFLMLVFNDLAPVRDLGVQFFIGSLLAFFGVFLGFANHSHSQRVGRRRADAGSFPPLRHGRDRVAPC